MQETRRELVITERGEPVLKIALYRVEPARALEKLRRSVIRYDDPTEPVGEAEWEALE